jgi:hypothetical protein
MTNDATLYYYYTDNGKRKVIVKILHVDTSSDPVECLVKIVDTIPFSEKICIGEELTVFRKYVYPLPQGTVSTPLIL